MWLNSLWIKDKTEWHVGGPWFWQRSVTTITGEPLGDVTMQRRIKGRWQYRNATGEEEEDYVSRSAW